MFARTAANIASIVINTVAALLGTIGLLAITLLSESGRARVSATLYGVTLVLAYTGSATYHLGRGSARGPIFQAVDHCTIHLLIAGTYTPFALVALWDHGGLLLLGFVWALAFAGIAMRLLSGGGLHRGARALYLLSGWIGLGWTPAFAATLDIPTIVLLLAGGVAYTVGAVFFSHRPGWADFIWHLCAVIGSTCHFFAVVRVLLGVHSAVRSF
jgi:hemolysin III